MNWMVGERPNKKNIESLYMTRKVFFLRHCRGIVLFKLLKNRKRRIKGFFFR